ncbi:hypothetical protein AD943_00590 [Gluconobacter roseus]|nr:hypothetical protein AD943_00590 [Gluconobacter roseus]GLP94429.1 hypothetical protein GCM10007871_24070 [Gluconobacter roseus NBRC 3990]
MCGRTKAEGDRMDFQTFQLSVLIGADRHERFPEACFGGEAFGIIIAAGLVKLMRRRSGFTRFAI